MRCRYGVPYKGSKNLIAERIVSHLPGAEVFVDLFAGGCAITHCAMASGKYNRVIANDLTDAPSLFADAVNGRFHDERRWISREDFFRLKDAEPYVRICWSYANNLQSYLYSPKVEPWKRAMHYARVCNDASKFLEMGIHTDGSAEDIRRNYAEYLSQYCRHLDAIGCGCGGLRVQEQTLTHSHDIANLKRLQSLERVQGLQSLERVQGDYRSVRIPEGAVVYADPPYGGTDEYENRKFDSDAFWEWVRTRPFPVYASEYHAPQDFRCIAEVEKIVKAYGGSRIRRPERLYLHVRWIHTQQGVDQGLLEL